MTTDTIKRPSRRNLVITGSVIGIVLVVIVVYGTLSRIDSYKESVRWTNQQAIPTVTLAKITKGSALESVALPSNIQPFNKAAIFARTDGYIKSWSADIGAHVKAGDVLGVIDSPDLDQQLIQAHAQLVSAQADEKLATLTAKRWHALVPSQAVSQQAADEKEGDAATKQAAVDAADANVKRLEALESFKTLVAPFDGVVTVRNTDIGALINAGASGKELFEVSDLHRARIYVNVPQALAASMTEGLKATFDLPQYPGEHFTAEVVSTSNAVSENSRTMLVQLQADNPDNKLWPGTYCDVHFDIPSNPNTTLVPATALLPADKGMQVAVLGDDNKVTLKSVELGRDMGAHVEIVSGLSADDRLIDNPPETLITGTTVQLAAQPQDNAKPDDKPKDASADKKGDN